MKKLLLFALLSIVLVGCSKDQTEPELPNQPETSVITFINDIDKREISSKYDGNIYDIYVITDCAKLYRLGDLSNGTEIKKHYPKSAEENRFTVIFKVAKNKSAAENEDFCVMCNRVSNDMITFNASNNVEIHFTENLYMRSFEYSKIGDIITNFGAKQMDWK